MAKKPTLTTVASGYQSTTMLNANLNAINNALDNTLSRDGSTPNNMTADIDLNSNDLLNVATTHTTNLYLGGSRVVAEGTLNTVSNMDVDEFTGDGSTVAYVLSSTPLTVDVVIVNVDGVAQLATSYTLSVATLTFSEAPPLNSAIQIRYFTDIQLGSTTSADLVSYSQGGTGHVTRTVEARLRDQVSVKDFGVLGAGDETTKVIAAVAAAAAAGTGLYWPAGTYTVTSTIPLLHTVKHTGPGVISSGGSTFYLEPRGTQANTLHVSTVAALANDGLTPGQSVPPKQAAIWLRNYGPVLDGVWTVQFAAGTYTQANTGFDVAFSGFKSTNRVIFRGPSVGASPAVPTAIFDGTGGAAYEHGLRVSGVGFKVTVQDLKFISFTGSNSRIGLVGENEVDFNTVNIHADSCDWAGVYASTCVHGRVTGGVVNACRSGVIFNATNGTVSAVDVTNCTQSGIYWSRGSQGHIDYCTLTSNAIGVVFGENSRCDTVDNTFTTNQYGIRTNSGGVFGEGGVANTFVGSVVQNIDYKAFSGDTGELNSSETEVRVASDRTTRAHSGAVATDIATVHTIPAHRLSGANKTCRVVVTGIFNSTTAGSSLSIKFGGMTLALTVVGAGSNAAFTFEANLYDVAGGYRSFGNLSQSLLAPRKGTATAGFDKTIDQDVIVAATLAGGADSMTIYRTDVFITG
jgi:hypothetical protein